MLYKSMVENKKIIDNKDDKGGRYNGTYFKN